MELNFSRGDLLQGQPITPAWHKGKIIKDALATEAGKVNYSITVDFEDPALAADERTLTHTFYNIVEKGKGFLVSTGFMPALLNKSVKEITDGLEKGTNFPFSIGDGANTGKKIQFYVNNEPYQGRVLNKITSFLPHSMEAPV